MKTSKKHVKIPIMETLPVDVHHSVLQWLSATQLARAAATWRIWARACDPVACRLLQRRGLPSPYPSPTMSPSPLRRLATIERLAELFGELPNRSWRDEWAEVYAQRRQPSGAIRPVEPIDQLLSRYRAEVDWLCSCGWTRDGAEALTLCHAGRGALGTALKARFFSHEGTARL